MREAAYTLILLVLLLLPHYAVGIEPDETGLKTGGDLTVPVIVLGLQVTDADVGLAEELVLREVELRLLRHGIIPADREAALALGWYLGINTMVVGSAYHVKVGFHRVGNFGFRELGIFLFPHMGEKPFQRVGKYPCHLQSRELA